MIVNIHSATAASSIDHELCLGGVESTAEKVWAGEMGFLSSQTWIEQHLYREKILSRLDAGKEFLFDEFQKISIRISSIIARSTFNQVKRIDSEGLNDYAEVIRLEVKIV